MPIERLAASEIKRKFDRTKQNLSNKCLVCRFLDVCRGGCVKNRITADTGVPGTESYFCGAYKKFFEYSMPGFLQIAANIKAKM